MQTFKPIKQTRISEEVLSQLKESILRGRYRAGDKLPSERELTEQLQVSRGAVREAIRVLEMTGFVIIRQGPSGGAFVTEVTSDRLASGFLDFYLAGTLTIGEVCEVRLHVEPQVARLAARHITPEGALRLRQALEAERIPFRDYDERMQRLTEVHHVINDLCGNHLFEAIVNSMIQLTHEIVGAVDPADHDQVHGLGEHDKLVAAILAGDEEGAAKAMAEHVISFTDRLVHMDQTYRTMRQPA